MLDIDVKLKPCPFCGSSARVWRTTYHTFIECGKYHPLNHCVQIAANPDEEAFDLWNRRVENEQAD